MRGMSVEKDMLDLSIVVVCYNMQRELPRTLFTLSRPYQKNIEHLRYEVIVVDNGSDCLPNLQDFADFDVNLRILKCDIQSVSPVHALNQGLSNAEGRIIGVMIDGARMVSPGMLSAAFNASKLHDRAIIFTQQLALGREPQWKAYETGYNQNIEDKLLDSIGWRENGYRLFEISTFPNEYHDDLKWFAPGIESNALFMPKEVWDETGGYESRFISPGGGAVSADLFIRVCEFPNVQLVVIAGEATFHQFHSQSASAANPELLVNYKAFSKEYYAIRNKHGRPSWPTDKQYWLFKVSTAALDRSKGKNSLPSPDRMRKNYVDLLKRSILNIDGIEAEAELRTCSLSNRSSSAGTAKSYQTNLKRVIAAREYGHMLPDRFPIALTMIGKRRLDHLETCVDTVINQEIPGDLVECGVWRGGASILMAGILESYRIVNRTIWVADSFMGLPPANPDKDGDFDTSQLNAAGLAVALEDVKANFARFDLLNDRVKFIPGWFSDTLPSCPIERISLLRLDGDLYTSTLDALENLYGKVSVGGYVIIDDYVLPFCARAVDEFRTAHSITEPLIRIDMYAVYWRKNRG